MCVCVYACMPEASCKGWLSTPVHSWSVKNPIPGRGGLKYIMRRRPHQQSRESGRVQDESQLDGDNRRADEAAYTHAAATREGFKSPHL